MLHLSLFLPLALKADVPELSLTAPHISLELPALLWSPVACLGVLNMIHAQCPNLKAWKRAIRKGWLSLSTPTSGFQILNMDLRTFVGLSAFSEEPSPSSKPSLLIVRFTNGLMLITSSWMVVMMVTPWWWHYRCRWWTFTIITAINTLQCLNKHWRSKHSQSSADSRGSLVFTWLTKFDTLVSLGSLVSLISFRTLFSLDLQVSEGSLVSPMS